MKAKRKLYFVCSRSWRACAPPPLEGVLPAATGLSLSRRQVGSRTARSSSTLRKTPGWVGTVPCRQLALGTMDPDHPLTAHLSAAPEIQVRPDAQTFCLCNRSILSTRWIYQQVSPSLHSKSMRQFASRRTAWRTLRELWMQEMRCFDVDARKWNEPGHLLAETKWN